MLNLTVRKDAVSIKESTGGEFINKSGIYPITINYVSLHQSESGAVSFSMNVKYKDSDQTLYGPFIQNKDGKENEIGYRTFNKLCIIAGLDGALTVEEETHPAGKEQTPTAFNVVQGISGIEAQVQIKQVFNKYKGEIKPKKEILTFFSAEGATADELVAIENGQDVKPGTQLAKIVAKDATTQPKLGTDENKQPVTQAEVEIFLKGDKSPSSAPAATKPKTNLFAR